MRVVFCSFHVKSYNFAHSNDEFNKTDCFKDY